MAVENKADLNKNVLALLKDEEFAPSGSIDFTSFWNVYQKKFETLPRTQVFHVKKRSELFQFCKGACDIVENSNQKKFVVLKKSESVSTRDALDAVQSKLQKVKFTETQEKEATMAGRFNSVYNNFYDSSSEDRRDSNRSRDRSNSRGRGNPQRGSREHSSDRATPQRRGGRHGATSAQGLLNFQYDFPPLGSSPQQYGNFPPPFGNSPYGPQSAMMPPFQYPQQPPRNFQQSKPRLQIPKDQLNSVAEDCIDRISEAKEFVSLERIEKLICQHYTIESLDEIGTIKRAEQIPCIHEHLRKICKVNAYIQAFVKVRSIATLHELHVSLKEFVTDQKDFETAKVGPLLKLPLAYEYFKVPQDKEILEITTADLMEHLRNFLCEKELWTAKVEVEEFMKYVMEKNGVESPYELGVRLRSMPLAMQVLKRAQRDCGQSVRNSSSTMVNNAMADLDMAMRNFVRSVVVQEPGLCEIRQQYLAMDSTQVLDQVFSKCKVLLDTLHYILQSQRSGQALKMVKNREILEKFCAKVRSDPLFCRLFQLAVCCGRENLHDQLMQVMGWSDQASQAAVSDGQKQPTKPPPSAKSIVTLVVKYIERCMLHGALTLSHLARVEKKVLEDLDFATFHDMGQGHFLDFLLQNDMVKKYLEECGGSLLGVSSSSGPADSAFHPGFSDLLEFLKQTGITDPAEKELVEAALCNHYGVREAKSLGHGTVTHLMIATGRQAKSPSESSVLYESAICAQAKCSWFGHKKQVGLMGHQTKEKAMACLQSCPLLEDLSEWSHWDLVFKPQLGELKDFLEKYGGVNTLHVTVPNGKATMTTNILALETKPGVLLKLTCDTSPEKFATATLEGSVRETCGHLVSLVITNKGLENTPLVLLGNHVKTALLKLNASESKGCVPGGSADNGKTNPVIRFVLECLTKLPLIICQATASQVFLEPVSHVVGAAKSKDLLLQQSVTDRQQSRLQLLGYLLGIQEWARTFHHRTEPPTDSIQMVVPMMDDMMQEVIEIDESETESESDSDASDFLDSDDEEKPLSTDDERTDKGGSVQIKDEDENMQVTKDEQSVSQEITRDTSGTLKTEEGEDETTDKVEANEEDGLDLDGPERVCKRIIDQIRKDEFGINVQLTEDAQRLMTKQQERLGRSLDRLSKDLYSKDTHFVLELIQNADDNTYKDEVMKREGGACPSVKFVVDQSCITVLNNECGFEEKNIRAVCDVGKSTKGKHKYGYIGQKGIGFKSVFRVTDKPEIHSNGYHVQFDVHSGPMGYILPHWVAELNNKDFSERWTTRIMLPLKEDFQTVAQTKSLAARFQDVHPSLLLFLHRLKSITVVNKVEDYNLKMQRKDIGSNVVEIKHSAGVDRWLVVKRTLDASHISLQAKSGVEVESTEVALAFPVQSRDKKQLKVLPQKQPVFAFLPLRSYGFRFIIQGDFDVPSSREDVDKDSLWNQWLRNELHNVFVEALETFKNHPDFDLLEAVCSFVQFIPLEDEILDFFRPVSSSILQQLRAKPCLPAQPIPGKMLEWKLPSQLVMTTDKLVKEVITAKQLKHFLSLNYLHDEVAAVLNPSLIQGLGIQTLTCHHLIEVGKGLVQAIHSADMIDVNREVENIAKWLACVYRTMDEFQTDEDLKTKLCALPMVPMADGQFVALNNKSLFFPLDPEERRKKLTEENDPLLELERDLQTVHADLFLSLDQVGNSQVMRLLERLGVKKLAPTEVLNHHILPVLKSDQWKTKSPQLLVSYLFYIKQQLERQPSLVSWEDLQPLVVIATNKGMKRPADEPIHFTPQYGNKNNLKEQLPGYNWTLIDPIYIANLYSNAEIHKWFNFFCQLGVLNFLAIKQETVIITPDNFENSKWKAYTDLLPDKEATYKITDFTCQQFTSLILENELSHNKLKQMRALFELMEHEWDSKYKQYAYGTLLNEHGHVIRDVDSSFGMALKSLEWLPAKNVEVTSDANGAVIMQPVESAMQPGKLYLDKPEIQDLLAHTVAYLDAQFSTKSSLLHFLGVHTSVTIDFVKESLARWCQREITEEDAAEINSEPAEFLTCLNHIKNVYTYLAENLPAKQLQDLLSSIPFIFVPKVADFASVPDNMGRILVGGRFLDRTEVRWHDPTGLFLKYKSSLQSFNIDYSVKPSLHLLYEPLADFFLRSARVEEKPNVSEYVELLIHITRTSTVGRGLQDVLLLLTTLGSQLLAANTKHSPEGSLFLMEMNNIKTRLLTEKVVPVKGGCWVSLGEQPMFPDDRQIERLFDGKQEQGVYFVDLGVQTAGQSRRNRKGQMEDRRVNLEAVYAFLEACGIGKLSENISVEYVTESYKPCASLQKYMHDVLPFIQKLLYTDDNYAEVYDAFKAINLHTHLASMPFGSVGRLEIVYSLKHNRDIVVVLPEKCRITKEHEFYVHKDLLDPLGRMSSFADINKELARFFSRGNQACQKEIRNLLLELMPLVQNPSTALDRLMEDHDLEDLPETEPLWQVSEPNIALMPVMPQYGDAMETVEGISSGPAPNFEGPPTMRAWPPMADPGTQRQQSQYSGEKKKMMWPPPAPLSRQDAQQLPANLRPIREDLRPRTEEQKSEAGSDRPQSRTGGQGSRDGQVLHSGGVATDEQNRKTGGHAVEGVGQSDAQTSLPVAGNQHGDGSTSEVMDTDQNRGESGERKEATHGDGDFKVPKAPTSDSLQSVTYRQAKRPRVESDSSTQSEEANANSRTALFDMPVWTDMAEETPYEEIGVGDKLKLPEKAIDHSSQQEHVSIGQWGEMLVNNHLCLLRDKPESNIVAINWVNDDQESGSPYDFEIDLYDEQTQTISKVYIEVKSTVANSKSFFEISAQEVKFAQEAQENYHLYRVFNAGDATSVRLTKLENLALMLDQKLVRLCMVV